MRVKCAGCGRPYDHGMKVGQWMVCPQCSHRAYVQEAATESEGKKTIEESRQPRLLTEDK